MHACYPMCLPIYTSVYIQTPIIGTDCIIQSEDGANFTQSLYTQKIPVISPHHLHIRDMTSKKTVEVSLTCYSKDGYISCRLIYFWNSKH